MHGSVWNSEGVLYIDTHVLSVKVTWHVSHSVPLTFLRDRDESIRTRNAEELLRNEKSFFCSTEISFPERTRVTRFGSWGCVPSLADLSVLRDTSNHVKLYRERKMLMKCIIYKTITDKKKKKSLFWLEATARISYWLFTVSQSFTSMKTRFKSLLLSYEQATEKGTERVNCEQTNEAAHSVFSYTCIIIIHIIKLLSFIFMTVLIVSLWLHTQLIIIACPSM